VEAAERPAPESPMAAAWRWQRGGLEWAASTAVDGHRDGHWEVDAGNGK
jgi:hypothetical protein